MVKNSYGFKPGRSIEDARMFLLSHLDEFRRKKMEVYVIFFDLTSAYDKVIRTRLKELLR